jgi:hypothetical protein
MLQEQLRIAREDIQKKGEFITRLSAVPQRLQSESVKKGGCDVDVKELVQIYNSLSKLLGKGKDIPQIETGPSTKASDVVNAINVILQELPNFIGQTKDIGQAREAEGGLDLLTMRLHYEIDRVIIQKHMLIIAAYERCLKKINDLLLDKRIVDQCLSGQRRQIFDNAIDEKDSAIKKAEEDAKTKQDKLGGTYEALRQQFIRRLTETRTGKGKQQSPR